MKLRSKGQLSINVIIVAAIALVVLVVLIAIFTGRFSGFRSNLEEQDQRGEALVDFFSGQGCQPLDVCDTLSESDCRAVGCTFSNDFCSGTPRACQGQDEANCLAEPFSTACEWIAPN